jgi:hypothetical protein
MEINNLDGEQSCQINWIFISHHISLMLGIIANVSKKWGNHNSDIWMLSVQSEDGNRR